MCCVVYHIELYHFILRDFSLVQVISWRRISHSKMLFFNHLFYSAILKKLKSPLLLGCIRRVEIFKFFLVYYFLFSSIYFLFLVDGSFLSAFPFVCIVFFSSTDHFSVHFRSSAFFFFFVLAHCQGEIIIVEFTC